MRGLAVARAKNKWLSYFAAGLVASCLGAIGVHVPSVFAQAGSVIGATVCASTSTVTIDTPVSDSIVTNPIVQISGSVTQSSQIEIEIDDAFDSSIQLSMGQTTYSGSIHLPVGTHTIKVTAVSVCPSANGMASSVVTYEAPPQTPSTGSTTPTTVGPGSASGGGIVVGQNMGVGISESDISGQQGGLLQQILLTPLRTIGSWLDINHRDTDYITGAPDSMGPARAVAFGSGLYLAIIGLAPSLLAPIAALPVLGTIIPGETAALRVQWLRRAGRIIGVALILGVFLL